MGRKPTKNKNLPTGMRARHRPSGTHYYLDTGERPRKEIPLGKDYVLAVQKWAELTATVMAANQLTFREVAQHYMREVLPTKAIATQAKNLAEIETLYKFFDDPPVEFNAIEPVHVRQFLDWRWRSTAEKARADNAARERAGKPAKKLTGKEGQVPANREKALLSHIWNFARNKGFTTLANPCVGITGFREAGRDVYVEDEIYKAVWECASPGLRDAMDLAYLSGQRPADVLKLSRADIKDNELAVRQNKTGAKLRITVGGQLMELIARIEARHPAANALVCNSDGRRMSEFELRYAFDQARNAAAESSPLLADKICQFQFRDLRAKAATDKESASGIAAAQDQLGHSTSAMTQHYVRHRKGKLVTPTK